MIDPSPELPDNMPVVSLELPRKVRHALTAAGFRTVEEYEKLRMLKSYEFKISGRVHSPFFARLSGCRPPWEYEATPFRCRPRIRPGTIEVTTAAVTGKIGECIAEAYIAIFVLVSIL